MNAVMSPLPHLDFLIALSIGWTFFVLAALIFLLLS
jgi:hypothetical protein